MVFFDASALVKAYVEEEGTGVVIGALSRMSGRMFISDFVALEVLTTLRTAFRDAGRERWNEVLAEFRSDVTTCNVVEVGPSVVGRATRLVTAHRRARARSMDVLHLATALHLQASHPAVQVTMLTSDRDLAALAEACGVRTFDPSREPLAALPGRERR
jgi:predicted nucleic acid-binding protein